MINRITLLGRLGRKPEVRTSKNNIPYAFLSVAVTSRRKVDPNTYGDKTEWFSVVTYNKTAELCAQYLDKGSQVVIEGKLTENKKLDAEGKSISSIGIIGDNVQFVGGKSDRPKIGEPVKSADDDFDASNIPF